MKKETERTLKEIDRIRTEAGVFAILKDGELCGRLTVRNKPKAGITHIAFFMYPYINHDEEIAAYERVTGWGFNRQDFGIHYVLKKVQDELKNSLGIEFTSQGMLCDHWQDDFKRAGFLVIQAL